MFAMQNRCHLAEEYPEFFYLNKNLYFMKIFLISKDIFSSSVLATYLNAM